jgi:hypothetical protein
MLFVDFSLMCFCLVFKIVLEIFDMCDSHSYACMCRVMAICCAGLGSCLYVSASGGSSSKEMSCAYYFRKGLDVEGACSAYDNWDNFDVGAECYMG